VRDFGRAGREEGGESGGEGFALVDAERSEVWVWEGVVCFVEVVVALCVADAVDANSHCTVVFLNW